MVVADKQPTVPMPLESPYVDHRQIQRAVDHASTDKWSRGFGMRSEICNVDF